MKKTLLIFLLFFGSILLINGQTNFAAIQNIDTDAGNNPWIIASGDLDGDGIVDIAMATYSGGVDYIRWYQNDGNGNFIETATSLVSSTITSIDGLTIADIDGQYGSDIIATSVDQDKLVYFLSNDTGGFDSEVQIGGTIDGAGKVVAGDINKDGDIDIALVAWGNLVEDEKVSWFSGDGLGGFNPETDIASGGTDGSGPFHIDIKDFDGDTDLDILVGYYSSGIEIYYNQYIESGSTAVSYIKDTVPVDTFDGSTYLSQVIFADVNNDGVMDVAKVVQTNGDVEWFNKIKNGASTSNPLNNGPIIARPGTIAVADVDNDNIDDVIITDAGVSSNALVWFKGSNGNPSTTPVFEEDSNHQAYSIAIDDFDYDGLNDIAYAGYSNSTGGVYWYENETDLLGINNNELSTIKIYPNPTANKLNFNIPFTENFNVSVYDILGKEVLNATLKNGNSLDVSKLNSGIYVLKFDNYNTNFKFVKE